MYVVASGSNIGLLNSFPVGKVEHYYLRPLSFREFLAAGNEPAVLKAYDAQMNSAAAHTQLSAVMDESVKRFKFKQVFERKSRYQEFESAISWLEKCRLVLKNFPIEGTPRSPLAAYAQDNKLKLFLFDVGLLNHMLGVSYQEIKSQGFKYKGFVAENFVQQEMAVLGMSPSYSWNDARAEIEFIATNVNGDIIPIEVKSGKRTRAKSLQSYFQKCAPVKTLKLTGTQGSGPLEQQHLVYPLYFTEQALRSHILNKS